MQILQSKIQECHSVVKENSEKLMNSSCLLEASERTEKMEEKIEIIELEMEKLQTIILELENKNTMLEK